MSLLSKKIKESIVDPAIRSIPLPSIGMILSMSEDKTTAHVQVSDNMGTTLDYPQALIKSPDIAGLFGSSDSIEMAILVWPSSSMAQAPWIVGVLREPRPQEMSARRPPL